MSRRTRERNPDFIGKQWSVVVNDGNSDMWLTCYIDSPIGPTTTWGRDMTPEIGRDIVRALRETADWWEREIAKMPETSGDVMPFKPKD
jgi:hypothetical protein